MARLHIPRQCLPRVKNRITSLYIEHAKISVKNANIVATSKDGEHSIPAAALAVLLLGPGTSITHDASQILAECGVLCAWSDSFGGNCHSFMLPASKIWNDQSDYAIQQAKIASSPKLRTRAVRTMFEIRYGDEYDQSKQRSISHMMGIEGRHVRQTYERCASKYGVDWSGRVARIRDMQSDDLANFAITMVMQEMYNIITAVCYSVGCIPSLGILHRGHSNSFVFDIADLWKESDVIPFAFATASNTNRKINIHTYPDKKLVREEIKRFMSQGDFAQRSLEAIQTILWSS